MKTAIISGASRGIGKAIASALAKQGYAIIINYLNSEDQAELLCAKIRSSGAVAQTYKADMSSPDEIKAMTDYVKECYGTIDLIVANAAIGSYGLLIDHSDSNIAQVISTDLIGVITLCREGAKAMLSQKSGNIITISSMWGEVGGSCESVYSAAKGGVIAFSKALAKELAPNGIRVNCVSPGFIDTDINANLSNADKAALVSEIPLGRAGTPEDVADAVVWLSDDKSSYITGQVISVNGGLII